VAAVALAIAESGDGRPAASEPPAARNPPLQPPPRPRSRPRDAKGYPEGTKREFSSTCDEQTPLDQDACQCLYDRLHDEYDYDEFRRLIGEIDIERRRVPPALLEHVLPCRLP
jgi:hypothetical protein